jgi:hypothetical protein
MIKPGHSKMERAGLAALSCALKGAICVLEAAQEGKGRSIEAIAKCALGMIQIQKASVQHKQYKQYKIYQMGKKIIYLRSLPEFRILFQAIDNAKKVEHFNDLNPLTNFTGAVEKREEIYTDVKGNRYPLGSHFHTMGGSF